MDYKQQLNDILRLRIFFQTEREMSQYIGYQLKGNHFNKFKTFQAEAYWSMFDRMCRKYSGDIYDLDNFIACYEATSKFWYRYISGKNIIADDGDLKDFLNAALVEQYADNMKPKVKALADAFNQHEKMDMAMLLLMTWGMIPSYTRKSQQDIADIKGDFEKVYERLRTYNLLTCREGDTRFDEVASLQELRYVIDNNALNGLSLCRMTLIALTNRVLAHISLCKSRGLLAHSVRDMQREELDIEGLWIVDGAALDDMWVIEKVECTNIYTFYHCTIDFKKKQIHYKQWNLCFVKTNIDNTYKTSIGERKFDYYDLLEGELPTRFLRYDYTSLTFRPHEKCVEKICFHINSPLGNRPLTLNLPTENLFDYYSKLVDSYEKIDDEEEYDVQLTLIDTAISHGAIYMKIGDCTYKLEKFHDRKETIEGICRLTIDDNIYLATLKVDGVTRQYLLIEPLNFSIAMEDILKICTISTF